MSKSQEGKVLHLKRAFEIEDMNELESIKHAICAFRLLDNICFPWCPLDWPTLPQVAWPILKQTNMQSSATEQIDAKWHSAYFHLQENPQILSPVSFCCTQILI